MFSVVGMSACSEEKETVKLCDNWQTRWENGQWEGKNKCLDGLAAWYNRDVMTGTQA